MHGLQSLPCPVFRARLLFTPRWQREIPSLSGPFCRRSIEPIPDKVAFFNFVQDITPGCDCAPPSGLPVVSDIGILASVDVVAIDKASLDLIAKAKPTEKYRDMLSSDILGEINETDSLVQIRAAQELGLGKMTYQLSEVK